VNIDITTNITPVALPTGSDGRRTIYINHDLRRGLPLPGESCEIIYSSHFFEHLDRRDGFRVMCDAYRALCPGGVFRIVIPDFRAYFEAYVRSDTEYFSLIDLDALYPGPDAKPFTIIDNLNYAVYQSGEHQCLYDEEKLRVLLTGIGFRSVERVKYDAAVDIDSPLRTRYSLYVEATK
jgi:predicted SAM-dependent methyltransferase